LIAGVGVLADIHPENVALRLLLQMTCQNFHPAAIRASAVDTPFGAV